MKNQPITVIVVLYQSKHLLRRLFSNLTDKLNALDEILLVDNAGEDLAEFASGMVKVIHSPRNLGYGGGVNFGIRNATNELIVAMNPDIAIKSWEGLDSIPTDSYFIASGRPLEWSAMRKFPSLFHDFFRLTLANLTKWFIPVRNFEKTLPICEQVMLCQIDWISGSLVITNKKTMERLGGFDEGYFLFYEEVDLCKRAAQIGIPRYLVSGIHFQLNQGTSSITDVSHIKMASEIDSAKRYHQKYSGEGKTWLTFSLFKAVCIAAWVTLNTIGRFSGNKKFLAKAQQYKIYWKKA